MDRGHNSSTSGGHHHLEYLGVGGSARCFPSFDHQHQQYKPTMREVAICPRCYFMGGDGFFIHSGPADNTSLMLSQQLRCHSIYNTRRTTSQSSLLPPVSSCFHFWNLDAAFCGSRPDRLLSCRAGSRSRGWCHVSQVYSQHSMLP